MAGNGVAAVDRALSILEVFTEDDQSLSLTEISKRTGLYKSTTLRLSESLEKFGYLRRSAAGQFQVGPKTLRLGSLYKKQFRTSEFVPAILRRMVEELHEGASFYVADGEDRVCLHRVDATRAVRDAVHEGDRLPAKLGASGHVLLAFSGTQGHRYEEIRQRMYAVSFGERDSETAAVACPVFDVDQALAGALTVSGPRYRIDDKTIERMLPVLFRYARELTHLFGGDPEVFARVGH